MRLTVVYAVAVLLTLYAIKRARWPRPRRYPCRINHCGRVFDTRDERALHFRRRHNFS